MKKRMGFVSNSSSSSFCILGKYFDDTELIELWNEKYPSNQFVEDEDGEWFDSEGNEIWDKLDILESKDLAYDRIWDDCPYAIGRRAESLARDKTIDQLAQEVADDLHTLFGANVAKEDIDFLIDGGSQY